MESPTSDINSNGDIDDMESSEPSTPGTPIQPFEPSFKVKVTDPIKDGEIVNYTVKTTRIHIPGDKEYMTIREYEDFEWLNHCIITQCNINGLVVPPLPPKPIVEAKGAVNQSKKQLGDAKVVIGDGYDKDCRALEKYLKLMINHTVFGKQKCLEKFLLEKEAATRAKVKKGIFGKLTSAVQEVRKANHRDIDEYFQKQRDWCNEYATCMKLVSQDYNNKLYAQQRVASGYGHLCTALTMGGGYQDESFIQANKLLVKFSESLEDAKHGQEVDNANDENTLGFHLDLYHRYAEAFKEMMYRRTCLLVDYEDANKALDKAKPQKKQAAEETKKGAEKAYEECTEVARDEMITYNRQRLLAFQEALSQYAEAKIKTSRDTYALLAKSLSAFKQMELNL